MAQENFYLQPRWSNKDWIYPIALTTKKQDKWMKQLSRHWVSEKQTNKKPMIPKRNRKQTWWDLILLPSYCLDKVSRPRHRIHSEPRCSPEFRRQSWKSGEVRTTRVHRTDRLSEKRVTQRENTRNLQKVYSRLHLSTDHHILVRKPPKGFPGGTVVESLPANAGDTGSSPGLGRSHMPQSG